MTEEEIRKELEEGQQMINILRATVAVEKRNAEILAELKDGIAEMEEKINAIDEIFAKLK